MFRVGRWPTHARALKAGNRMMKYLAKGDEVQKQQEFSVVASTAKPGTWEHHWAPKRPCN